MEHPFPSSEETANGFPAAAAAEHATESSECRAMRRYPTKWNPSKVGAERTAEWARRNAPDTGRPDHCSRAVKPQTRAALRGHSAGFWRARSVGGRSGASEVDAGDIDHYWDRTGDGIYWETNRRETEDVGEEIGSCMEAGLTWCASTGNR